MSAKRFLSLKWKAAFWLGLALFIITGSFSTFHWFTLRQQYYRQHEDAHLHNIHHFRELIQESYINLQQAGEMIDSLEGMHASLRRRGRDAIKHAFDRHWPALQLRLGLEVVQLYAPDGTLLGSWTTPGFAVPEYPALRDSVATARKTEGPTALIHCAWTCIQYAVVPLLAGKEGAGATAVVGASLADALLSFRAMTGVDIGIISRDIRVHPDGRVAPVLKNWTMQVKALTNRERALPVLNATVARYPSFDFLRQKVEIRHGDRHYHVEMSPVLPRNADAFFVLIDDQTDLVQELAAAVEYSILAGIVALLLSSTILFLFLRVPIARLTRMAGQLPFLAHGAFEKVRASIRAYTPRRKLFYDEFDALADATLDLSDQLEKLQNQVAAQTRDLQARMSDLGRERDFVTHLLDTAQAIILTQTPDGEVRSINDYGRMLTGCSEADVVGHGFGLLFSARELPTEVRGGLRDLATDQRSRYEHESSISCKDGSVRTIAWMHSRLVASAPGQGTILSMGMDITSRKQAEARLAWMAEHDSLTGLMNRRRFENELAGVLAYSQRYTRSGALLYMDVDHFKHINDTAGHGVGDEVLKKVAQELERVLRSTDIIARLGGDEFAVILREVGQDEAVHVVQNISSRIAGITVSVEGRPLHVSVSIGIALFPDHGTTPDAIMANADIAMYQSKLGGHGRWRVFVPGEQVLERMRQDVYWRQEIKEALEQDRFLLYYQPILDTRTRAVSHYEALLRMRQKDDSVIGPASFLATAEHSGQIREIDCLVIRKAINRLAEVVAEGHDVRFSINISGSALKNPELPALIEQLLKETGVGPSRVIFEITETAAALDLLAAQVLIEKIRALGCRFTLDKFGVSFSSFYYVKQLPVDYIKLEGSFVQRLEDNVDDQILIRALHEVAKGFGKKTIAEFVDREETLHTLEHFGVDYVQGYLIGKPSDVVPIAEPAQAPEAPDQKPRSKG